MWTLHRQVHFARLGDRSTPAFAACARVHARQPTNCCAARPDRPTRVWPLLLGGANSHFLAAWSRPTARARDAQSGVGPVPGTAARRAVRRVARPPAGPLTPRPAATPPERN